MDTDFIIAAIGLISFFITFPMLVQYMSNDVEQPDCELEWVECSDDDRVGDCELHKKEIVTGPYWNETKEFRIILRKQICKEQ